MVTVGLDQHTNFRSGRVSTGMSDVCWFDQRPQHWYLTSHPGQLSLAISPWVGAILH